LQTYVARGNEPNSYRTTVGPKINAQYHQHIFSLRVDPTAGGPANSVLETDVVPFPTFVGSPENFAGNALTAEKQTLKVEGPRDYDWAADKRRKIINTRNKHYASDEHTCYGVHLKGGTILLLAKEGSWVVLPASMPH